MITPREIIDLAQEWLRTGDELDRVGMAVEQDEATPEQERVAEAAWMDACEALRTAVRLFQEQEAGPVEAVYVRVQGKRVAMTQEEYAAWRQKVASR